MGRWATLGLVGALYGAGTQPALAQATGTTSFNAPYRAFERSEIGGTLSFLSGGGIAVEGQYRFGHGRFDLGMRGGILDPDVGGNRLIVGGEARTRVIEPTPDSPLDGAFIIGVGGRFGSGDADVLVPAGLSLGRRFDLENSPVSIVPYVQPTLFLAVGDGSADVEFAIGLGGDFHLSAALDARVSVGLGDVEGISIGAIWVH